MAARTYSECWACYALSDADLSPHVCGVCGRKPVKTSDVHPWDYPSRLCASCRGMSCTCITEPVTAPTTGVQVVRGEDGHYSLTGLSEDDLWTLYGGVTMVLTESGSDMDLESERRLEKILRDNLPD